ncbi:MAG: hypothetical protein HY736_13785 [Verrucomicrobia bacterium]|nr:hypothetical protein [Verrucomicrobiota bacterium]
MPALVRGQDEQVQSLQANGVEVRLRLEPTNTTTAGRIAAELGITAPASVIVEIGPPPPQPLGQLSVASATTRGPVVLRPGVMEYGLRVVFTPFLGGTYEVPAFTVAYRSGNVAGELVTKPVPVLVASVIDGDPAVAAPAALVPIEEGVIAQWWLRSKWLDAVVMIIALVGWLIFRRRQRSAPVPAPILGPFAAALAALETEPAPDARVLERVLESLRADEPELLPETLGYPYQWIRFGSPTGSEIERFTHSLKEYLREKSRSETPKEVV